jgi:hypothetical protein
MRLSRPQLADYRANRSRHDFRQRQLMNCLILRAYLRTTYRGVVEWLAVKAAVARMFSTEQQECLRYMKDETVLAAIRRHRGLSSRQD